jgi:hypothetical protein
MKCEHCRFFSPFKVARKAGVCTLQLPPWLSAGHDCPRVAYSDGCDLGQAREPIRAQGAQPAQASSCAG